MIQNSKINRHPDVRQAQQEANVTSKTSQGSNVLKSKYAVLTQMKQNHRVLYLFCSIKPFLIMLFQF